MDASSVLKSSVSKATSYEEIGEFWDTHSLADYEDVLEEVEFEYVGPAWTHVARYLWDGISAAAKRQGVQPETLVNLWLMERLAGENATPEQPDAAYRKAVVSQDEMATLAEEKAEYRTESES